MDKAHSINKSGIPPRIFARGIPFDKNARVAPLGTCRVNEARKWASVSRRISRLRHIHKFLYYTWQAALVRITHPRAVSYVCLCLHRKIFTESLS